MRPHPTSRAFGRTALALTLGAAPAFGQVSPADIPGDELVAPAASRLASVEDPAAARAAFSVQRSVRDLMTAPLVAREGEELWVRTRDSRGRFAAGEFTLFPIFGPQAAHEHPIHFTLAGAALRGHRVRRRWPAHGGLSELDGARDRAACPGRVRRHGDAAAHDRSGHRHVP